MAFFDVKKFLKSLKYAAKGFIYVYKREQNIRIQLFVGVMVVVMMMVVGVSRAEAIVLLLVIFSVLILEFINTTFEALADILRPRMHHYVAIIKDIMAATVLLASLCALLIGVLIFSPYVWSWLT